MTHEERTALRTILQGIGTRVSHRTDDREICRLLGQRFRRLARDIDWLEALKDRTSRFAYQTLLNALYMLAVSLAVLVSTATLQSGGVPEGMVFRPNVATTTGGGDPPPSATCILELHRAGEAFLSPFRQ